MTINLILGAMNNIFHMSGVVKDDYLNPQQSLDIPLPMEYVQSLHNMPLLIVRDPSGRSLSTDIANMYSLYRRTYKRVTQLVTTASIVCHVKLP